MPGLVIGIPTLGRPTNLDWAMGFKSINPPINYNTVFSIVKGRPVAEARNMICEEAIKQNAKYVLFVGDDTIPPPHMLRQFIFRMENIPDCGVVGGVYCSKSDPPAPLVFRENGVGSYWDWKLGEFFEVTGLGMDCTMIRVDVLKEIEKPWFVTVDKDNFLDGTNNAEMWTEDLYFLDKVAKTDKWKIYCDASVLAKHIDIYSGREYFLPPNSLPFRAAGVSKGEKKIIDLGCGPQYTAFEEGTPIRVDLDERWNPDYRCDVRNLPFDNGEFDIVFSSHVLEHFNRAEHPAVLAEWIRILKPTGELRLVLPNILWAARALVQLSDSPAANQAISEKMKIDIWNVFYGAQSSPYDFHYNGFTPTSIKELLHSMGLYEEKIIESGYNMNIIAKIAGSKEIHTI